MKNKAVLIILFLLVVSLTATTAMAVHDSTVSWNSSSETEVYEFASSTVLFKAIPNVIVDPLELISLNFSSSQINLTAAGSTWEFPFYSKYVWHNHSGIDHDYSEILVFQANEVSANTTSNVTVFIQDTNGNSSYHNLSVTVLNDDILPSCSLQSPTQNYAFARNGSTVTLNYLCEDNESGLKNVTLYWEHSPNFPDGSDSKNEVPLSISQTSYDLTLESNFNESPYMNYLFKSFDKAGNANNDFPTTPSSVTYYGVFVDHYAPELTLGTDPTNNLIIAPLTPSFTLANVDDDSFQSRADGWDPIIKCTLDINGDSNSVNLTSSSASSISMDTTSYVDGWYAWNVTCEDDVARSVMSETRILGIDGTAPNITANNFSSYTVIKNGTNLVFTIEDPVVNDVASNVSTVWYNVTNSSNDQIANATLASGLNNASVNFAIDTSTWEYGPHTLNISAQDRAGNVVVESYTIVIDNKGPNVTLLAPENNMYSKSNFSFTVNDMYSQINTCELFIYNGFMMNHSIAENGSLFVDLDDGDYSWNIVCNDTLGNENVSETWNVYVDNTLPTFDVNSTFEGAINESSISINFSVSENNPQETMIWLYNESGLINSSFVNTTGNSSPQEIIYVFSNLKEGSYSWNATALDKAGNYNGTDTYTLTLDTTNPGVEVISPLTAFVNSSNLTILVNVSDANLANTTFNLFNTSLGLSSVNYSAVGGLLATTFTNLSDDNYSFNIISVDQAGNRNESLTYNLTIDTTTPTVTIVGPTDAINVNNSLVNFTINYTDENAGVCEFYVDGMLNETILATDQLLFQYNFTESNNVHSWYVRCNDSAGNWYNADGLTQNNTLYYDTTIPQINTTPDVVVNPYNATVSWTTNESTTNIVEVDGVTNTSQSTSSTSAAVTVTGLNENTKYTYRVWSCDAAGLAGDVTHCVVSSNYSFTTTNDPSNDPSSGSSSSSSSSSSYAPLSTSSEEKDGSSDGVCTSEWTCSEWSACVDGKQVRTCSDVSECFNAESKPAEQQACQQTVEEKESNNLLTGNVVGESKGPSLGERIVVFTFLGLVLFGSLGYTLYRRVNRKTKY
ncbi:MAG: hypothetical protein ACLFNM_02590 [Candidatus Woesearchaeota archaeon]